MGKVKQIAIAFAVLLPVKVSAAPFPEFDVREICHRDSVCAGYQFLMRTWVARDWNKLTPAEQSRCVAETADNYDTIWSCVHSFLQHG